MGLLCAPRLSNGVHNMSALHATPAPDLDRTGVEQDFGQLLRDQQSPAAAASTVFLPLLVG
ncbi:hypothetical protein NSPZN2_130052 [Nitrospira defluvii]|uniref:Uncharacterized protein n=1 Tax=Nitrospira defluvii TaxID=330214 RepID=A0ABM8R969_9BACT|nr:hypothetical protein NSPZN2_130052 [Nitrospira defluvii]